MSRDRILIAAGVILLALAGGFVAVQSVRKPTASPSSQTVEPGQLSPSGIVYGADGKLDTSDWQEYRSEYGGFSVRAPKEMSRVSGCTHACDSYWGERFEYLLFRETGDMSGYVGPPGLSMEVVEKNSTSTLDTWLDTYIVYGKNYLTNVQKTNIKGHPALQFDFDEYQSGARGDLKIATMQYDAYPWGYTSAYELSNPSYAISRYMIIDLGNRYVFVQYLLSVDKKAEVAYFTSHSYYLHWVQVSQLLDDKTLTDVYAAIFDSFQAFTPTKP